MRAWPKAAVALFLSVALMLAGAAVGAAPGIPAGALPAPAPLQARDAWVLPDLAGDGWVAVKEAGPLVVGYYAEDWEGDGRALEALRTAAGHVDRVVNFALQLNADGSITTRAYPALQAEARGLGLPVYGLVHNMKDGNFSAEVARSVLADPAKRSRAVSDMVAVAQAHGLDGIDIDIENVPGDLRPYYTALVTEAAAALRPRGIGITVSVPAKVWDDRMSNWGGAFDYAALGAVADQVAVMAYDEHTYGLPEGPVASLPWVERVVAYATQQIPKEKILLGIPAYGYAWVSGTNRVVRGLSTAGAYQLAARHGAGVLWDDVAQVPYFTYTEGGVAHTVYFENGQSTAAKLGVVTRYGLGGIAIWRLGLNEQAIWEAVSAAFE
ncbi:spore germination protein YaaH [Symbiobacterium terraclitae]|uniref:Spore germination protein YaaH n=1 Tax=Symbiobacterium terraclitae TaxID=557451 RepID=A0ABS4JMG9_9FIRM|nr:spore germination protein YaaH [Symbiobacterium terraclitae]